MEKFEINILGCGSALPTIRHLPTSQVINFRNKLMMIDCGEGAQLQFRKMKLNFSRLTHIFLSHLHGDHCFGLIGLISTLGMLGRTGDLFVYAPAEAEKIFRPMLDFFCKDLSFAVVFKVVNPYKNELVYEDKSLEVYSIPLKHRMPCCGYLFKEKPNERHIKGDMVKFWKVPIKDYQSIKDGADWTAADGTVIKNAVLSSPADPARSYAYCSDTCYNETVIPIIRNVDLLYHEATFAQSEIARSRETLHTTGEQAAAIAKSAQVKRLVIGHFSARYENEDVIFNEAKQVFDNIVVAKEGMTLAL